MFRLVKCKRPELCTRIWSIWVGLVLAQLNQNGKVRWPLNRIAGPPHIVRMNSPTEGVKIGFLLLQSAVLAIAFDKMSRVIPLMYSLPGSYLEI